MYRKSRIFCKTLLLILPMLLSACATNPSIPSTAATATPTQMAAAEATPTDVPTSEPTATTVQAPVVEATATSAPPPVVAATATTAPPPVAEPTATTTTAPTPPPAVPPPAASAIEGVEVFPRPPGGHTESPVTYPQTPPVGGEHHPYWINCGVYTEQLPPELAVHSMEHGAVWITYRPDLSADQVGALQNLTRQTKFRLLSPYPNLPAPIVLSAWGYQLKVENANDSRIAQFLQAYENSPDGPEFGAPCEGGIGQPK